MRENPYFYILYHPPSETNHDPSYETYRSMANICAHCWIDRIRPDPFTFHNPMLNHPMMLVEVQLPLTSSYTCANTAGTLKNNTTNVGATATPGISAFCGNASSPDVWYSFVAQSTFPTITLSGMGSNMDDNPRLQLFNTNSCTVATLNANSNNCVSGASCTTLALTPSTALTIGTTYLIRVFTNANNVTATPSSTWNFNICVVDAAPANDAWLQRHLFDLWSYMCKYFRHTIFSNCDCQHLSVLRKHNFSGCMVFICCTIDIANDQP